jgi:hypothetical protein
VNADLRRRHHHIGHVGVVHITVGDAIGAQVYKLGRTELEELSELGVEGALLPPVPRTHTLRHGKRRGNAVEGAAWLVDGLRVDTGEAEVLRSETNSAKGHRCIVISSCLLRRQLPTQSRRSVGEARGERGGIGARR